MVLTGYSDRVLSMIMNEHLILWLTVYNKQQISHFIAGDLTTGPASVWLPWT